jgi:adenine-specific DNA methylase
LVVASDEKLRGGFYTPPELAAAAVRWAVRDRTARVLEPSAGDGAFVRHVDAACDAIELSRVEASKVAALGGAAVHCGDAFSWFNGAARDGSYDAVVGNPPFIRYQNFPEAHREEGFRLMRDEGLAPNRLTNAWVPFVVLATRALRDGGRLALVLPAEVMQVSYAAQLRAYLATRFRELTVITFRRVVFPGIQQETILLLGVRGTGPARMSLVELDDLARIEEADAFAPDAATVDLDHATEKWTQYYLSASELGLVREIAQSADVARLGQLASVDVGIVTGRNQFFVMAPSDARMHALRRKCVPLVGRSAQIPGLVLAADEWRDLEAADQRCLLLQLGDRDRERLSAAARRYVEHGETLGYHEGYKCRIRLPNWWKVPSVWAPDAFLLRQIHDGPRVVANEAAAVCTDTIHRMRCAPGVSARRLAASAMNSMTWAFSEILGRSYGGGVLELEPTEAEQLPFPTSAGAEDALDELDLWARRKDATQVLDEVDAHVLRPLGLTSTEIATLRAVWQRLSARRRQRR